MMSSPPAMAPLDSSIPMVWASEGELGKGGTLGAKLAEEEMLRSAVAVASRVMRLAGASSRTAISFYRPVAAAAAAATPVEAIRPPLFSDSIKHRFFEANYPNDDDEGGSEGFNEFDEDEMDGLDSDYQDFEDLDDNDDDEDDEECKYRK